MRVLATLVLLLTAASPARAEQIAIDLAAGVTASSLSRPPGTIVRFVVENRLPTATYKVVVETRSIDIPAFPAVPVGAFAQTDPCKPFVDDAAAVAAARDEGALGAPMGRIREAVAADACRHNPAIAMKLRELAAATRHEVPGTYEVEAGREIVVTVSRGDKTWLTTVSGGARGKWLTSYGATAVPDRSRKASLKGDAANGFVVTPDADPEGPRVLPSVFFTWMSSRAQGRDWTHGPTAGLGISDKAPGLFAGWSATYNGNLSFLSGVGLAQHTRLRGKYKEGEVLPASLDSDQLHEGVYKPTWMIGVTFRFGENPFGAAPAKPAGKGDGTQKTP